MLYIICSLLYIENAILCHQKVMMQIANYSTAMLYVAKTYAHENFTNFTFYTSFLKVLWQIEPPLLCLCSTNKNPHSKHFEVRIKYHYCPVWLIRDSCSTLVNNKIVVNKVFPKKTNIEVWKHTHLMLKLRWRGCESTLVSSHGRCEAVGGEEKIWDKIIQIPKGEKHKREKYACQSFVMVSW
jgi:hypothetical protein